jgi:hypothetical protein
MGQITKVTPDMIQVANNVTSTTIGNTTSGISLTFDSNGVITSAANVVLSVANTQLTGTITNAQLGTDAVSNTKIAAGAVEQYFADTGYNAQFRNRIINGDMRIDQRNAGASVTPTVSATYTLDRWNARLSVASKFSVQQNAGSVTPPAGFVNYLGCTSLSAYTVGSSETFTIQQIIEGLNCSDLAWGTANAKTVTLSFQVYSSLTGTFGGTIQNSASNRSYPFSYTVSAANTWEQKSITIAGDTTGTWLTTNGIGIRIQFSLGTGSSISGTAGAWSGSNLFSATGATSVVGTDGATFYITGVQLEVGSVATPFERRPFGTELALCQRYFTVIGSGVGATLGSGTNYSTTLAYGTFSLPVRMRATPTISNVTGTDYYIFYRNNAADNCNSLTLSSDMSPQGVLFYNNTEISGTAGHGGFWITNNAAAFFAVQSEL